MCFLPLPQLSLFFDILLCMARNVNRKDFLVGQPPEMGQGDTEGYLQGARAELWRELRDQPLTMGGYYLLALWGDHGSEHPPGCGTCLPGPQASGPGRPSANQTITLSQSRACNPLPFFLCLVRGL